MVITDAQNVVLLGPNQLILTSQEFVVLPSCMHSKQWHIEYINTSFAWR